MLTYNRPQFISRAIESLIRQRFEDWELLAVQDGENEEIFAILQQWQSRDCRIRHLPRGCLGNIAEASNYGLARALGRYVAVLDDDDYWATPEKLSMQAGFLEGNAEYVACSGGMIVVDREGQEQMRCLKPERDEEIKKYALYANPIIHTASLYRLEAAQRCGGYDAALSGFQDWDLWLKLGRLGKLYNFPEYLTYYQIWEGGGTFQQSKGNTTSALRIVMRHRQAYRGFLPALALASSYYLYARLPLAVRRRTYKFLAGGKRRLFSSRGS